MRTQVIAISRRLCTGLRNDPTDFLYYKLVRGFVMAAIPVLCVDDPLMIAKAYCGTVGWMQMSVAPGPSWKSIDEELIRIRQ